MAAGASGAAVAGERPESVLTIPDMVVTASRLGQAVETVPFAVNRIETIGPGMNASGAVDDALGILPGFSLFRRTSSPVANPTTQGFTLRGIGPSGASRSLLLLDGVPLNDAFGGWVYWSQLNPLAIDRVEVVSGGGGTAWGGTALGGVVQIVSREPESSGLETSFRLGNRDTYDLALTATAVDGPWSSAVDLRRFGTGGYLRLRPERRGSVDEAAGSSHLGVTATVGYAPGEAAWSTQGRISYFEEERRNGTRLTRNDSDIWRWQQATDWQAGPERTTRWSWYATGTRLASTFSSVSADRSTENLVLDQFRVPSRTVGTAVAHSFGWGEASTLEVGLDGRWIDGSTNERIVFSDAIRRAGGEQLLAAGFMENQTTFGSGGTLTLGGRMDRWWNRAGSLTLTPPGGVTARTEFPGQQRWLFSPRVGWVQPVREDHRVRAAAYRGFRVPTINELYRPFQVGQDRTSANAALRPESNDGVELGWTWQVHPALRTDWTIFQNNLQNAVANVTQGPNAIGGVDRQRQNLERIRVRGIEWEGQADLTERLTVVARYAWLDARVREASVSPELVGRRLAQTARHQASGGLLFRPTSALSVGLDLRYRGAQFEDDQNTRLLGSFVVLDLRAGYDLREHMRLTVAVDNLLNRRCADGVIGDGIVTLGAPRLITTGIEIRF